MSPLPLPTDKNLEAHGSHALTSIMASGSATIGRSFGHSLRRAVSVRHSTASRYSREGGARANGSRPSSIHSNNSRRHSGGGIPEEAHSPSRTFVDLRPNSGYDQDSVSNRSSVVSTSSISTIGSWNPASSATPPAPGMTLHAPTPAPTDKPHHLSSVYRVSSGESPAPNMLRGGSPRPSSSASSLHSPVLMRGGSPRPSSSASSAGSSRVGGKSPQPPARASPLLRSDSSSSSLDSLERTLDPLIYDTPV